MKYTAIITAIAATVATAANQAITPDVAALFIGNELDEAQSQGGAPVNPNPVVDDSNGVDVKGNPTSTITFAGEVPLSTEAPVQAVQPQQEQQPAAADPVSVAPVAFPSGEWHTEFATTFHTQFTGVPSAIGDIFPSGLDALALLDDSQIIPFLLQFLTPFFNLFL